MKKNYPWILLSGGLVALSFAPGACGGGGTGTTTTAGTGGASSSSTTTTHTASSTGVVTSTGVGGAGGSAGCMGVLGPGACTDCLVMSCCAELADCNNDPTGNCISCITGQAPDPTVCMDPGTTALSTAVTDCVAASCMAPCTPPPAMTPPCNPVTNEGCTAGQACDGAQDMNGQPTFQCYDPPPPNTKLLCDACDDMATACVGGLTCISSKCAKYCCTDAECGSGKCAPSQAGFGVGICLTDPMAGTPACDAKPTDLSQGGCVQWTGAMDGGAPDSGSDSGSDDGGSDAGADDAGMDDAGDGGDGGP